MDKIISIVIPVHNRENLIRETLESINHQNSDAYEVIIVDDHSSDNSYIVAQKYNEKLKNFKLYKRKSTIKGAASCRNEGINLATGDYIMFLDSDDIMDENCINNRLKLIKKNENYTFYVFPTALFNEDYKVNYLTNNFFYENGLEGFLNYEGGWHTSSSVFKTDFLKKNHYFDINAISWQDVEFHIRAILKDLNFKIFPNQNPDVFIRQASHSRISNSKWNYEKLNSRINLISQIEKEIISYTNSDKYTRYFKIQYLWFLNLAARNLTKIQFKYLLQKMYTQSNLKFSRKDLIFLKAQNYFSNKDIPFVPAILFRTYKLCYSGRFEYPKKKMPYDKTLNLRQHLSFLNFN